MPQLDTSTFISQIFWLILCFGVVVFCYVRIFIPKFNKTIEKRLSRIQGDIDQAAASNQQVQTLIDSNQEKLDAAHNQVNDKISKTLGELEKKAQSQLRGIDEELSANLESMQKYFERQKDMLSKDMNAVASECVHQIMAHLVDGSLKKTGENECNDPNEGTRL